MAKNIHIKKTNKLFNPLRFSFLILIFLSLSITTITLNLAAREPAPNGINDPDGRRIDAGVSMDIVGPADAMGNHETCRFKNNSTTLDYFIPTRHMVEWTAVKSAANVNHVHLELMCCGAECDGPGEPDCTPINCFDYEALADANDGRNCGPALNDGCGNYSLNCGCQSGEICTIEPGDNGFPIDSSSVGDEIQGYCKVDTGCNPVVYPSTHSEFGRLYCVDVGSCNFQTGCDTAENICASGGLILISANYIKIYNNRIDEFDYCYYMSNNGTPCQNYFHNHQGTFSNYYAIFFHNKDDFPYIETGDNYYVDMRYQEIFKDVLPCSAVPNPDPDPDPDPSGTCTGAYHCSSYVNETDCQNQPDCIWN